MAADAHNSPAGAGGSSHLLGISSIPSPEGPYHCTATTIGPVVLTPSLSLTPGTTPPPPPAARLSVVSVRHPRRGSGANDDASTGAAALAASTGSLGALAQGASSSGSQSGGSESGAPTSASHNVVGQGSSFGGSTSHNLSNSQTGMSSLSQMLALLNLGGGPTIECVLASQGVDAPASHMTGGGGLPPIAAFAPRHAAATNNASASGAAPGPLGVGASSSKGAKDNSKKPKNSIKQTSSSFVQRLTQHAELAKILAARADGDSFAFLNSGKSFLWLADLQSKIKEPLARMAFASPVTAHDVNQVTRSSDRLDIVLGFASGDLLWLDPVSSRYTRINKGGIMIASRVTQVRWLPGSENLFLSSHADGTMMVCDRYREDAPAGSWTPASVWSRRPSAGLSSNVPAAETEEERTAHDGELVEVLDVDESAGPQTQRQPPQLRAWDSRRSLLVTRPGESAALADAGAYASKEGKKSQQVWAIRNPISHWRVCETKINDFAFSPDYPHCAIVSEDGMLRLVDFQDERLEFSFNSYFGAINCATWSPDGRFLVTGSCDDLVTIWAPREGRIIARCPGHASFVRAVAFDPWRWRVDDRTYRFASVGEDNRLILWDFSSAALQRPKHSATGATSHGGASKRHALGSTVSLGLDGRRQSFSARRASMGLDRGLHTNSEGALEEGLDLSPCFDAPPRGAVAELQPISIHTLSPQAEAQGEAATLPGQTASAVTSTNQASSGGRTDLLCGVRFNLTGILVLRRSGATHSFDRPAPPPTLVRPASASSHTAPRSSFAARRPITQTWRSEASETAA